MANGSTSQVQFKWQRPMDRIYRVGTGLKFGTVMSAINAAVADGAQPANPAYIEIYPNLYTENVTFYPGVHLIGMGSRESNYPVRGLDPGHDVVIQGNHGLNTDLTGPYIFPDESYIDVRSIGFFTGANALFTFSGANIGRINFYDCFFSKNVGDAPVVVSTNTNANSRIRMNDTIVYPEFPTAAGFAACDISGNATLEFYGKRSGVHTQDGFILNSAVRLAGLAVCNVRSQNFADARFTQVFDFTVGGFPGPTVDCHGTRINNTLAGGIIANYHANTVFTFSARESALLLSDNTAKIVSGSAGGLAALMNCSFVGFAPDVFNTVDPSIQVVDFRKASVDYPRAEFYVGSSRGYATIAAAITAANASGASVNGRKTIRIAPGTYNENLTLIGNIDLIADSPELNSVASCPVVITGNHTWAAAAGSVKCKGIYFNNNATAGVIFNMTGSVSGQLLLEQCYVKKTQNDHTAPFLATGSGGIELKNSSIYFEDDSVACFVFFGAVNFNLLIDGNLVGDVGDVFGVADTFPIVYKPKTTVLASTPFLFTGSGSKISIRNSEITSVSQSFIIVGGALATINVASSKINFTTVDGQFFKYAAAGSVNCVNSFLNTVPVPNYLGAAFIARDAGLQANGVLTVTGTPTAGIQASGTVTLTAVADGDNLTINGQLITFKNVPTLPDEVAIGGSDNNAATNLATYLNTTASGFISGIVTGLAALNVVTVTSVDGNLASNAITLVSGSGSIAVSGATLTGGLDGDTLNINGDILMFGPGPAHQIPVSGVTATQAQSIAAFVDGLAQNNVSYPNIFQKVYAYYVAGASALTIKAFDTGVTLNGATLTYTAVGAPAITAPGTLAGGTATGGGNFIYGGLAMKKLPPFNSVYIQSSLTVEATLSQTTAV